MKMPAAEPAILQQRQALLAELAEFLPPQRLIADKPSLQAYDCDALTAPGPQAALADPAVPDLVETHQGGAVFAMKVLVGAPSSPRLSRPPPAAPDGPTGKQVPVSS